MPKNTRAAGTKRERQVREIFEDSGFEVKKARASLGAADLVAVERKRGAIVRKVLIQVKANKGSPYMNFRKDERDELSEDARMAGAEAWLVHWPPHGRMDLYPESDWPGNMLTTPLTDLGL